MWKHKWAFILGLSGKTFGLVYTSIVLIVKLFGVGNIVAPNTVTW